MSAFSIIEQISKKYNLGWNEKTWIHLMNNFIEDKNLEEEFLDFLTEKAELEEEMNEY